MGQKHGTWKLHVCEMGCLKSIFGLTLWNRVRSEEVCAGGKAVIG